MIALRAINTAVRNQMTRSKHLKKMLPRRLIITSMAYWKFRHNLTILKIVEKCMCQPTITSELCENMTAIAFGTANILKAPRNPGMQTIEYR